MAENNIDPVYQKLLFDLARAEENFKRYPSKELKEELAKKRAAIHNYRRTKAYRESGGWAGYP